MSRTRAIEAVSAAGTAVLAAGVAEPLVDFVGNLDTTTRAMPVIEPVLLSLCCYQLNQRRPAGGKIDIQLLQQAGQDILQDLMKHWWNVTVQNLSKPAIKAIVTAAAILSTKPKMAI